MTYENGDVYQGEFYNGSKDGFGIMTYDNKLEYSGDWVNDKREGKGVLKNLLLENKNPRMKDMYKSVWYLLNENAIYYGEWKNDMYHGLGVKANVTCDDVDIANCIMPPGQRGGCPTIANYVIGSNNFWRTNANDMGKFDFYFGVFRKNKIETDETRLRDIQATHTFMLNQKPYTLANRFVVQFSISFHYVPQVNGYSNKLAYQSYWVFGNRGPFKTNVVREESCRKISDYFLFDETTGFLYNLKNKKKDVIRNVKKQMLISKYKKDLNGIVDLKKELKRNKMATIALICILVGVFVKYSFNKCKNYFTVSKNKKDLKKEIKTLKKDFSKFKKENKDLKKENENLKDILRI
jgi:hypothetical protein